VQILMVLQYILQQFCTPQNSSLPGVYNLILNTENSESLQFLCLIDSKIAANQLDASFIELAPMDIDHYRDLRSGEAKLTTAIKSSKKRSNRGDVESSED
jgi:hypothetical protein